LLTTEANTFKEEMLQKIKHVSHVNQQHIYPSLTATSFTKMTSSDDRDGKFFSILYNGNQYLISQVHFLLSGCLAKLQRNTLTRHHQLTQ
jgi:hypothetical protein